MSRHLKCLLPAALLMGLVTGCSRIQLAYKQLDWFLPVYLDSYLELSAGQSSYLKQQVKALLAWHCSTHLARYADVLRAANADFQRGEMTRSALADYSNRIEGYWREIVEQASPAIATLLADASTEQLDELFAALEKRNRKWLRKYRKQKPKALRADYVKRMTRELQRWFGPLQPAQARAVQTWGEGFQPLGELGLEMRQRWQSKLRELTARRNDRVAFLASVENLLTRPQALRTPQYQARLDANREATLDLVYRVGKGLDKNQRQHLDRKAEAVARDFDALACQPAPLAGAGTRPMP